MPALLLPPLRHCGMRGLAACITIAVGQQQHTSSEFRGSAYACRTGAPFLKAAVARGVSGVGQRDVEGLSDCSAGKQNVCPTVVV